jgi:hypothetical protein
MPTPSSGSTSDPDSSQPPSRKARMKVKTKIKAGPTIIEVIDP